MHKVRFTAYQIIAILTSVEAGRMVRDVCRETAQSESCHDNCKAEYGEM